MRLDDPYGDVSKNLAVRESGKHGYRIGEEDYRNSKNDETGVGEDNLWLWGDIKKTIFKYAIIIKNN